MHYNKHREQNENICVSCKRDYMHLYNMEKAKTQKDRTILHLQNVIRNMVEACEEKDSKKLRLWADVGKLEIGRQISAERWNKYVAKQ